MGEWRGIELTGLEIPGERLLILPFQPSDEDVVLAAMAPPDVRRFLPMPDPYTREHAHDWVNGAAAASADAGTGFEAAVVERSTGRLVGAIGFRLPGPRRVAAEIGYVVYPHAQGRGIAAEATRMATDWGFAHGLQRAELFCSVSNMASVRTAMNAGMRFEGVMRGEVLTPTGIEDGALFARLPEDAADPVPAAAPPIDVSDGVLALRPLGRDDVGALVAERANPESERWSLWSEPFTPEKARQVATTAGLEWVLGRQFQMAMVVVASGDVAGTIALRPAGPPQVGNIGYGVIPAFRGRGFTARALRLLAPWAFETAGYERLELGANVANLASQRAAERGGFLPDGVRTRRLRTPDGSFGDEACFHLLK